ncbi:disintegrin and metalloproteinase domain-containing protein 10 [Microplitis demolitor]|uniref:disintegrin and metalloproteinase domain-containing protein 10 n=1 Tax=Microplitis demolitor TaxID=69319 RepID=UPI00044003CD|nr:disintegrin and metalloproteinase domain-containing protein 10 [Microplitis demolitor]
MPTATIQWALAILSLALIDASPLHPLPPHAGITKRSYIGYYEPVSYDTTILQRHRSRGRRDVSEATKFQPIVLHLRAFDREWTMRLVQDTVFAKDAVFEGTNGPIAFDSSHSYTGTIAEDDNAIVEGIVTEDGLFDGFVSTGAEEYYFEPTSRYLTRTQDSENKDNDTSPTYHTIAYRASDVVAPPQPRRCPSRELHKGNLKNFVDENNSKKNESFEPYFEQLQDQEIRDSGGYYSRELNRRQANKGGSNVQFIDGINRDRFTRHLHKRATVDPRKTTCMLYLQADHQFFSRYGTEEACIEVMTRHVQRVNSIYKHTDFNQDGRPDNISFMIKRVKVHNAEAMKDPHYRFPNSYGVEKFLELFSEEDYDAFCLAYMFTYRDFEMGTLGLAWTGDLKNAGGVCEKNGHYRGSMKSLNTGIVTLLNYGKHVPPAVSHVTLAHEIGHNFGSPHDPEQCTPGGEDGNFIMFARATSGDKRNNNRFSPCSLNAINPVLNTKARSPKGCFTEPQASLCGNGVIEDGEECDCGWEEDCRDSCCFPQRRYPPAEEKPCTLTPRSICSPSQGPCCTTDCKLKFSDKCREDNGCRDASFCDGRSPHCPPSINKPNKTICNRELVCFMGECTGSICLAYGLESCQCIPGPDDPPTKACELCCRIPGGNQPCLSSFDWNSPPYDIPDMFSKPGTPCNDYNGYCDVFQKCREVDPSGPLATLRKLLLSDESLATFRRWVVEHWYAVAILILAAISLLVATIRFLGKRSNPKLKSVTIIHSSTTETVRLPPEGAEGVTIHPPAVRAKLPLNQKVREKRRDNKQKNLLVTNSVNNSNNKTAKITTMMRRRSKQPPELAKKKKKKKKRVVPIVGEEPGRKRIEVSTALPLPLPSTADQSVPMPAEETPRKVSSKEVGVKKKRKKKEINYSITQGDDDNEVTAGDNSDPKSKVRSWLLASHGRVEPTSIAALPKSKSTPVGLAGSPAVPSPRTAAAVTAATSRTRPMNIRRSADTKAQRTVNSTRAKDPANERVRLQIVYKPPFKFSVKLRKTDKNLQTSGNRKNVRNYHPRTAVLVRASNKKDKFRKGQQTSTSAGVNATGRAIESSHAANSDLHTVPSDLEVLLSESEFLFSDA